MNYEGLMNYAVLFLHLADCHETRWLCHFGRDHWRLEISNVHDDTSKILSYCAKVRSSSWSMQLRDQLPACAACDIFAHNIYTNQIVTYSIPQKRMTLYALQYPKNLVNWRSWLTCRIRCESRRWQIVSHWDF